MNLPKLTFDRGAIREMGKEQELARLAGCSVAFAYELINRANDYPRLVAVIRAHLNGNSQASECMDELLRELEAA